MMIVYQKRKAAPEVTTHPKALRARLTTFTGRSPAEPAILIGGKDRHNVWNVQENGKKVT